MIVYKIIQYDKIKNIEDYIIGNALPMIQYDNEKETISSEKEKIEHIFEEVRCKEFSNHPSRRKTSFFVFLDISDEFSWLFQMSKNESMEYLLVTLEVNGDDVCWYDVDDFDDSANKDDKTIHQNAKKYWLSKTSKPTSNKGILYEGLVTGDSKIVNLQTKYWNHRNRKIVNIEC